MTTYAVTVPAGIGSSITVAYKGNPLPVTYVVTANQVTVDAANLDDFLDTVAGSYLSGGPVPDTSNYYLDRATANATYGPRVKLIAPWQANHVYAVGDQYVDRATGSFRRWQVSTAYTSGAVYGATDIANSFVLVSSDGGTSDWSWYEAAEGSQGARVVTNHALWVLPDSSESTDSIYSRPGDNTKSALELEGALAGPGTGRVMGVVVWDWGGGSLVFQIGPTGDVTINEQRHLIFGAGSHATATSVASGSANGTSAPAPTLATGSSDTSGCVFFGSGTSPGAGPQVRVTFGRAFAAKPFVVVTPGYSTAMFQPCVDWPNNVATSYVDLSFQNAPTASQSAGTYSLQYMVIG